MNYSGTAPVSSHRADGERSSGAELDSEEISDQPEAPDSNLTEDELRIALKKVSTTQHASHFCTGTSDVRCAIQYPRIVAQGRYRFMLMAPRANPGGACMLRAEYRDMTALCAGYHNACSPLPG